MPSHVLPNAAKTPYASHSAQQKLAELRERVDRLERGSVRKTATLPFQCQTIDRVLPGGGLTIGALHDVQGAGGHADGAAATLFVAGILARTKGTVLWCLRSFDLFAPGLAGVGLHPDRVIYAENNDAQSVLRSMEEGLKHGGLAGVVGEVDRLAMLPSKRLQLAAETSGTPTFALRRWQKAGAAGQHEPTAAVTRWRVSTMPSAALGVPGVGRARWRIELLRCRNAEPASWIVEASDAQGLLATNHIGVPADLADRSAEADSGPWRAAG